MMVSGFFYFCGSLMAGLELDSVTLVQPFGGLLLLDNVKFNF